MRASECGRRSPRPARRQGRRWGSRHRRRCRSRARPRIAARPSRCAEPSGHLPARSRRRARRAASVPARIATVGALRCEAASRITTRNLPGDQCGRTGGRAQGRPPHRRGVVLAPPGTRWSRTSGGHPVPFGGDRRRGQDRVEGPGERPRPPACAPGPDRARRAARLRQRRGRAGRDTADPRRRRRRPDRHPPRAGRHRRGQPGQAPRPGHRPAPHRSPTPPRSSPATTSTSWSS